MIATENDLAGGAPVDGARGRWLGLICIALGQLMLALDATIMKSERGTTRRGPDRGFGHRLPRGCSGRRRLAAVQWVVRRAAPAFDPLGVSKHTAASSPARAQGETTRRRSHVFKLRDADL